jgi:hypothetical protein
LLAFAGQLAIAVSLPAQSLPVPLTQPPSIFEIVGIAFNLDPSLLQAIASVESGGHATAVSPKGASGLMQLMPDTARRFGVSDPFNPVESVLGAARFLAYLHEYAGIDDLPQLLAAYNAGEGAVSRYRGLPPYPETREYVRRVLLTYLLGNGPERLQGGGSMNSCWLKRSRFVPRIEQPIIRPTPIARWAAAEKPKTEADVFAQLEQIRSGRSRAMEHQKSLNQTP